MALTDVKEVFNNMSQLFNPNAAQGLDVVIQYDITGDSGGKWHIELLSNVVYDIRRRSVFQ